MKSVPETHNNCYQEEEKEEDLNGLEQNKLRITYE
jgi:hypothetical protein